MLTEKELMMYRARKKKVKVICKNGVTCEGYCEIFTQPLDNDPEVASICVTRGFNREAELVEITEPEIEKIEYVE